MSMSNVATISRKIVRDRAAAANNSQNRDVMVEGQVTPRHPRFASLKRKNGNIGRLW